MSDGKTHAVATAVLGGIATPVLFRMGGATFATSLAFAAGCLAGLVINPDLDIRHTTHSEDVLRHSIGGVAAGLWFGLWWPYSHLIPYHRHLLSHFPLVGTTLRLLYLALIIGLLWGVAAAALHVPGPFLPELGDGFFWWAGGLAAADALHTLMDIV